MTYDSRHPGNDPLDGIADSMDQAAGAMIAQATHGLSPATMFLAGADWAMHLASSPGKQMQLAAKMGRKYLRLFDYMGRSASDPDAAPAIEPLPQDRRFSDPAWQQSPFNFLTQAFLLNQQWWHAATTGIGGVSKAHEAQASFAARQMLDIFAPTNFLATNPVLQRKIVETGGKCLIDGMNHMAQDMQRQVRGEPPVGAEAFRVGETVATTQGKVVWRNPLIELIQYAPTTEQVRPEPILIMPAWIMKYYILDLSPENSLVRWLTGQGYTVFMVSWHNPTSEDRNLDLDAYRRLGAMAALDAVGAITGSAKIHGVGYCLGGTLLAGLFIDESQLATLKNLMSTRGYLDSAQMGGAFQILRSNDLVWSQILQTYLMGERPPMNDLMAWNADGTRMPYAMHSEYLTRLFLNDELAEGKFAVDGRTVALSAIRAPLFVVGTERDHVAPWRSVHKIHLATGAETTFILTSGGHNAGIVSEPGHAGRRYRVATKHAGEIYVDPDTWRAETPERDGSWWPEWQGWLAAHSSGRRAPPGMGAPSHRTNGLRSHRARKGHGGPNGGTGWMRVRASLSRRRRWARPTRAIRRSAMRRASMFWRNNP